LSGARSPAAVFIHSKELGSFTLSPEHPFKPERMARIYRMCAERGLFAGADVEIVEIGEPEEGVLERFHDPAYLRLLRRADGGDAVDLDMLHHGLGSAENPVFRGVHRFAALSATASLTAARLVVGGAGSAFNACGGFHHAHPDRASGFCYVNDVTIAINEIRGAGLRVAYVDIDAHHGDAVQEAYYDTADVLVISIHETGKTLFPWGGFEHEIGEGAGRGSTINVPLEPESDDEVFLHCFDSIVMEALTLFDPDVVVGQFGTDMLATDPLTHLRLTNNGYIEAVERLHGRFPRVVALGGGGYSMADVERCLTLVWAELAGIELDEGYGGAMGGVFLGDASISGSDLRDMRSYTSGPAKERAMEHADRLIARFEGEIRPLLTSLR
jgi:acetoin utilization protein AcuC